MEFLCISLCSLCMLHLTSACSPAYRHPMVYHDSGSVWISVWVCAGGKKTEEEEAGFLSLKGVSTVPEKSWAHTHKPRLYYRLPVSAMMSQNVKIFLLYKSSDGGGGAHRLTCAPLSHPGLVLYLFTYSSLQFCAKCAFNCDSSLRSLSVLI